MSGDYKSQMSRRWAVGGRRWAEERTLDLPAYRPLPTAHSENSPRRVITGRRAHFTIACGDVHVNLAPVVFAPARIGADHDQRLRAQRGFEPVVHLGQLAELPQEMRVATGP